MAAIHTPGVNPRPGSRRLRVQRTPESGAGVMGVLNVTPDSFSDGGRFLDPADALAQARAMIEAGVDVIDVGGESTRPGAEPAPLDAELQRVIPVIEALRRESDIPISIDSSKAEVMRAAVAAGADLINDVYALRREGALAAASACAVPVCLMHMRGEPRTMQRDPVYGDVVAEVGGFLRERAEACLKAGIPRADIVLDPGFGFGKTVAHNLELLNRLEELARFGYPLLVGLSRKSTVAALCGDGDSRRLIGSVTLAAMAVDRGAVWVRCHDVEATRRAVAVASALRRQRMGRNV